ncbi:TPA: hypothetical protein RTH42_001225 [Campylobacter jejuni]|nr:hypothetical protein [Campylobacter jejuni]HDZ4937535.1 hypothetical protein [Campylobacter jejuni]HDZ4944115.1 hypothetical protein [Campylobacter jejuni]HDZ4946128.1 hypothetical protein [Campylobacter jejuni]HDZ4951903.1 hypothetical protein [Campylobacter jejuni]
MSDLRNKILNDLRDESLKICKELSSIKDTTKKAELIKNLALLNDIEMAINDGKAYKSEGLEVKVMLLDRSVCFLSFNHSTQSFKISSYL